MAEFNEVMMYKARMCKSHNSCRDCGLNWNNNGSNNLECTAFMDKYPKKAEEIIMNWAKENPCPTNADKFKEVFGFDVNDNTDYDCGLCKCDEGYDCNKCKYNNFWNKQYISPTNDFEKESHGYDE